MLRTRLGWSSALALLVIAFCVSTAFSQTTAFTYQGRLTDAATPASGTYDFQFVLYDQLSGGTAQPAGSPVTVTRTGVQVANGIFTTTIDFGVNAFPGADRFLEISVKLPSDTSYITLSPRQPISSSPYSIQTLNAAQLGGVPAGQYVQTSDARLSDARPASSVNLNTAPLTGVLQIVNGGTGSATKNFVDLTLTQTVTGAKTFSNSGNVFAGNGTGLTLGQNVTTVLGTTGLSPGPSFVLVPGLTQTINIPANGRVCAITDGGFQTTSPGNRLFEDRRSVFP